MQALEESKNLHDTLFVDEQWSVDEAERVERLESDVKSLRIQLAPSNIGLEK